MRTRSVLVAALLFAAACTSATTTTTTAETSNTTSPDAVTTTSGAPSTTERGPTTTVEMVDAGPQFVISSVSFGTGAMVVITNVGSETGNLAGHFLCQRPNYWAIPDIEVPAGQSVAIGAGGSVLLPPPGALTIDEQAAIGQLSAGGGEVALYDSNSFGSSGSIQSYVEWGNSGHPRSSVAVAAGIWPSGGFVATTTDNTVILANTLPATEPDSWDGF